MAKTTSKSTAPIETPIMIPISSQTSFLEIHVALFGTVVLVRVQTASSLGHGPTQFEPQVLPTGHNVYCGKGQSNSLVKPLNELPQTFPDWQFGSVGALIQKLVQIIEFSALIGT